MYIHYSENQITLHWTVFRGVSVCPEDFSRAKVVCLLDSRSNKVPAGVEVVQGEKGQYLSIVVPAGLSEGVYDVLAVWTKNEGRSIARSRLDGAFAVTDNASESTDKGSASTDTVVRFRSSAGTYGYDGLSGYELALLKGMTTKDETTWVAEQIDECRERIEAARNQALDSISSSECDALDQISGLRSTSLSDIDQRVSHGLDSIDAGIDEAATAIQTMQDTAVAAGQAALESTKTDALAQIGGARTTALSDIEAAGNSATSAIDSASTEAVAEVNAVYNKDLTTLYDKIFTAVNPVGSQTYYTINADSTMWENVGRSNWIAVTPGATYRITAANHVFDWAFMTSNERANNTPVTTFAEGWTAKAVLGANESVIATAPADAAYIYYKTGVGYVAAKDIVRVDPVALKAWVETQDSATKNSALASAFLQLFPKNIREQGKMGTLFIDAGGKWTTVSGWRSWWTPVTGGRTYVIRANTSASLAFALLTSDQTNPSGQAVTTWAEGWTERRTLAAGEVAVVKASADAKWLMWAKNGTAATVPATPNAPQLVLEDGGGNVVRDDLIDLRYEIGRYAFHGRYVDRTDVGAKCREFASALLPAGGRADKVLFMTDPHLLSSGGGFSEAAEMTFKQYVGLMLRCWECMPLDSCVCGGDWLNQDDTPSRAMWKLGYMDGTMRKLFGERFHHVMGNHDTNYIGTAEEGQISLTYGQEVNTLFSREGRSYYSFDMGAGRGWVFDSWTAGTASSVPPTRTTLFTEQVTWFGEQLLERDDAHNVVFVHAFFTDKEGTSVHYLAGQLSALASAYNSRGSFTFSGRTFDFSGCTGVVHCFVAGHTHTDLTSVERSVPVLVTTNMQAGGVPTFDLLVFDYDGLEVRAVRVGTGESRTMTLAGGNS